MGGFLRGDENIDQAADRILPQLQSLYEGVYDATFDTRNFTRKLMCTGWFIKMADKDKSSSKKGAFYYKLDKRKCKMKQEAFEFRAKSRKNFL